jgi:uncharacterized membrane protein
MQLKQVLVSGVIFLMFDSIYLYTISDFFNQVVKEVQGEKIQMNLVGAIFSYLFLIFGLNYFILDQRKSLKEAFLYGFVMYGVYETTNYALLKKWSPLAVLMDTFWGGCLYLLSTYFTRRIL